MLIKILFTEKFFLKFTKFYFVTLISTYVESIYSNDYLKHACMHACAKRGRILFKHARAKPLIVSRRETMQAVEIEDKAAIGKQ